VRNRLLIRNLPVSATPEQLQAFFGEMGYEIQEIAFGPSEKWRLPYGYAVVMLSPNADSSKAIEAAEGKNFQGRALIVDGMKPRRWRHRSERAVAVQNLNSGDR
jgi:hypothetical protein